MLDLLGNQTESHRFYFNCQSQKTSPSKQKQWLAIGFRGSLLLET